MYGQDASTFLKDFGEPLSWQPKGATAVTGLAFFDAADTGEESGGHISREYTATLETSAWPGLKRGEQVVQGLGVTSKIYKLRTDLVQEEDGVFSTVKLTRVVA